MAAAILHEYRAYPLRELGQPAPIVLNDRVRSARLAEYRIPSAWRANRYVLLRLRLTVRLSADSGSGRAFIAVTGRNGTSSTIEVRAHRRGSSLTSEWSAANPYGAVHHAVRGRVIQVDFPNYLRNPDASPGLHELRVTLERFGRVKLIGVRVSPVSAIRPTREQPYPLRIRRPRTEETPSGPRVAVPLVNLGPLPVRRVTLNADVDRCLKINGPQTRRVGTLGGRRVGIQHFSFTRAHAAPCQVNFQLESERAGSVAEYVVPAPPSQRGRSSRGKAAGVSFVSLPIGVAAFVVLTSLVALGAYKWRQG